MTNPNIVEPFLWHVRLYYVYYKHLFEMPKSNFILAFDTNWKVQKINVIYNN